MKTPELTKPPLAAIEAELKNNRNHLKRPLAGRLRKR